MVLLISYICGIVLVELKLLQVFCNTSMNHLFISKQWFQNPIKKKKKETYSGGQKAPLKVRILCFK